jgi:hypothetical protein
MGCKTKVGCESWVAKATSSECELVPSEAEEVDEWVEWRERGRVCGGKMR